MIPMKVTWVRFTGWFFFGAAFAFSWMSFAGIFAVPVWMALLIVLSMTGSHPRPGQAGRGAELAGIPGGLAAMFLFVWALNPGWWGLGLTALALILISAALINRAVKHPPIPGSRIPG